MNAMASLTPDSTAAPLALTDFTLFPKLAVELRLKIFQHALPTGPRGIRVLKVAADSFNQISRTRVRRNTKKTRASRDVGGGRSDAGSYLTFRLLEHEHSVYVRDVSLLGACSESRGVYLKYFTSTLEVGEHGVIRFAMQDIVYVANFDVLARLPEMLITLVHDESFDGIRCGNLALPTRCFDTKFLGSWNPDRNKSSILSGQHVKFFGHCKGLKVVGAMLDDMERVVEETQFNIWRHNESLWKKDTEENLKQVRRLWVESAKVLNEGWTPLELGLWDYEGVRLEPKWTDDSTSSVS